MNHNHYSVISLVGAIATLIIPTHVFAHSTSGQGLVVTPQNVQAPSDTVPRFCNPPQVASVVVPTSSGTWSNPAIWPGNTAPLPNANIQIPTGITVTYDVNSTTTVNCIEVQGNLTFATNKSTKLVINEIMVMPTGALTIGTVNTPIASNVTTEVIFRDTPLLTGTPTVPGIDPKQYGHGLIVFGDVTMHGAKLTSTFLRADVEPKAGDRTITVRGTPSGWKVGDEILLPDTRAPMAKGATVTPQDERHTITSINGAQITLQSPLAFTHECARDGDNTTITTLSSGEKLCPHVANLTRNITFRSENPNGVRGHAIYLHRSQLDIRYAAFKDMGRTLAAMLDNSTFDATGKLTRVGTNQIGKYPFHMHHLWGPVNPTNTGYQAQVIGNAIVGSKKWGMTVHNTHYVNVTDNIIHDLEGAGIATEDGTESHNEFIHNFISYLRGPSNAAKTAFSQFGDEFIHLQGAVGDAFWGAGANNTYRDNVATTGIQQKGSHGYVIWAEATLIPGTEDTKTFTIPLIRGADMKDSSQTQVVRFRRDGDEAGDNSFREFDEFNNNEVYASGEGMSHKHLSPGTQAINNFRIWNVKTGIFHYYSRMNITNLIARPKDSARAGRAANEPSIGIEQFNQVMNIDNADIQGADIGIILARRNNSVKNTTLRNHLNIKMGIADNDTQSTTTDLTNVKFEQPANASSTYRAIAMTTPNDQTKGAEPSRYEKWTVSVIDYNKIPGNNFRLFFKEQAATYVGSNLLPTSCPDTGFTNQQCWDTYGVTVFGEIASCTDTTTRPEIDGITCGGATNTPSPTPEPSTNPDTSPNPTATPTTSPTPVPEPPTITTDATSYTIKLGELLTIPIKFTNPAGGELQITFPNLQTSFPGATIK